MYSFLNDNLLSYGYSNVRLHTDISSAYITVAHLGWSKFFFIKELLIPSTLSPWKPWSCWTLIYFLFLCSLQFNFMKAFWTITLQLFDLIPLIYFIEFSIMITDKKSVFLLWFHHQLFPQSKQSLTIIYTSMCKLTFIHASVHCNTFWLYKYVVLVLR